MDGRYLIAKALKHSRVSILAILAFVSLVIDSRIISAQAPDSTLQQAQQLFEAGQRLEKEGTPDSIKKAIESYRQAANFFHSSGEKNSEALAHGSAGLLLKRTGDVQDAVGELEKSAALFKEIKDQKFWSLTLLILGDGYADLKNSDKAVDSYAAALPFFVSQGDHPKVAQLTERLGRLYRNRNDFQRALSFFGEAREAYKKAKNSSGEVAAIAQIGWVYADLGNNTKSLELFLQALPLVQGASYPADERLILENIGELNLTLQNFKAAISYYEKALSIATSTNDKTAGFNILLKLALGYRGLREWEQGLNSYRRALEIAQERADKQQEGIALFGTGALLQERGDHKKAVDTYQMALSVFRAITDKADECLTLNTLGISFLELNERLKALESFQQAFEISKAISDKSQEGIALFNIGGVHEKNADFQKAIGFYEQALPLFREAKDPLKEAVALSSIGFALASLGETEKAFTSYEQALSINRKISNKAGEANTINSMALLYGRTGQLGKELEYHATALNFFQGIGDKISEANILVTIAQALEKVGDRAGALERYNKALRLYREANDRRGEAQTLAGIGLAYHLRGEIKKAEALYTESLEIVRASGDKEGEAAMELAFGLFLNSTSNFDKASERFHRAFGLCGENDSMCIASTTYGLGLSYHGQANYQKAIDFYSQSISISRTIGFREGAIASLNGLGEVYVYLGLNQRAMESFKEALRISSAIGGKDNEARSLGNIGYALFAMEDYANALEYHQKALAITQAARNRHLEAFALNNVGLTLVEMKKPKPAIDYFEKSLDISRSNGNRSLQAVAFLNLGYAYNEVGDHKLALKNLREALFISRVIDDSNVEAFSLGTIALVYHQQRAVRNMPLAAFYGKSALNIVQSIRSKLKEFDLETQKAFISRFEKGYRKLADIFIEMGRFAEAERVLAMLKEVEYFEYLRRDDNASVAKSMMPLSSDEQKMLDEFKKYADNLAALGKELAELQSESKRYDAGKFPKQQRLDELEKLITNANKVFNAFLDDLKTKFGEYDSRVASVESGAQALLKELREPATVMVSTIAGPDRLNLIVTTSAAQRAHVVDIKAGELNKLVFEFRDNLKNPRMDPKVTGKKLFDIMFPSSLQKDLEGAKADTIVWSLDGTLRYVPIAALWDGKQYLVERYRNVVITLASRDRLGQVPTDRAKWEALGLGVSKEAVLKDADGSLRNFEPLTSVPEELCGVVADPDEKQRCSTMNAGKDGLIAGKNLLNEKFTLATFKNLLGRYPVVHIASHFSLNPGNENDSYLLLGGGDNRKFTLADVRQGGAKFVGVELLTLSACNTAMTTGNRSNGVEVEGFGALAQNQGAKSVVASLWPVADNSTRDLMIEFYKHLESTPQVSKAEALRQAQLSLLKGRFAHPYYWSPFVLMGNWQ